MPPPQTCKRPKMQQPRWRQSTKSSCLHRQPTQKQESPRERLELKRWVGSCVVRRAKVRADSSSIPTYIHTYICIYMYICIYIYIYIYIYVYVYAYMCVYIYVCMYVYIYIYIYIYIHTHSRTHNMHIVSCVYVHALFVVHNQIVSCVHAREGNTLTSFSRKNTVVWDMNFFSRKPFVFAHVHVYLAWNVSFLRHFCTSNK